MYNWIKCHWVLPSNCLSRSFTLGFSTLCSQCSAVRKKPEVKVTLKFEETINQKWTLGGPSSAAVIRNEWKSGLTNILILISIANSWRCAVTVKKYVNANVPRFHTIHRIIRCFWWEFSSLRGKCAFSSLFEIFSSFYNTLEWRKKLTSSSWLIANYFLLLFYVKVKIY